MHFYNLINYYSYLNKVYADCSGIIDEEVGKNIYIEGTKYSNFKLSVDGRRGSGGCACKQGADRR